jgi:hypothetical protein
VWGAIVRASDYLTPGEIVAVAEAEATGVGGALLRAARAERKRIEGGIATDEKINCERVEDDLRFHLGMMRGLEFFARLR